VKLSNVDSFQPMKAIERPSLADHAYECLLEALVSGSLPGGTELNAVTLAGKFEISRTPVQEAIRRLVADGLAVQQSGHKARVVQFQRCDVIEIYAMRELLEGAAAEAAAKQLTNDQLAELRMSLDDLATNSNAVEWTAQAIQVDLRFHDVIASAAKNSRLREAIGKYRLLIRSLCHLTASTQVLKDALQEHMRILESLEVCDPRGARKAMVQHIAARRDLVLTLLFA
jgi:DNA-binding GntR family transcriptional regulator